MTMQKTIVFKNKSCDNNERKKEWPRCKLMRVIIQKFFQSANNKRIIIIAILVFSLIQLAFSIQLLASTFNYDRIYRGIYVKDIYVSGLTTDQAVKLVKDTYEPRLKSMRINLKTGELSEKVEPISLVNSLNVEKSVESAFNEGRTGNLISRLFEIASISIKGKSVQLNYDYDEEKLQQIIGRYVSRINKKLEQNTYKILEDKIVINIGKSGQYIDEAKLRNQIIESVENMESVELDIPIVVMQPDPLSIDNLHTQIFSQEKDAAIKVKNHKVTIVPSVLGRDFDIQYAKNLLENKKNQEGSSFEIPLKITYPKKVEQDLKDSLFKDELSSFSTKYNKWDKDRSNNVVLAASKINGVVLGPGDVFSYNQIVGQRTVEQGFKKAHVYMGGKIVDGLGGGICQVSTTLYNTVLFANLEVVERRNHNMLVGYVPPGRDATVSYGSIDFKFKNNYKAPIKILSAASEGKISIKIMGTNEYPGRKIELETEILSSSYLPEKIIDDPTKLVGYYEVVQKSMRACKANTYKIIKQDGKMVSRKLISTNKYNPLQKTIIRGTKKKTVENQKPKPKAAPTPIPKTQTEVESQTEPATGPDPGIPFDDISNGV